MAILACGACGAEATGSDRFCGNCGMKMKCSTCGHDRHVAACDHKLGWVRRRIFRREYCCCTQVDLPRGVVGIRVTEPLPSPGAPIVAMLVALAILSARYACADVVVEDHGDHPHVTGTLPEFPGYAGEPRCLDDASCTTTWGERVEQPMCVVRTTDGLRCVDVGSVFSLRLATMPSNTDEGIILPRADVALDCQQTVRRALEAAQRYVRDPDDPASVLRTELAVICTASCQLERQKKEIADQKEAARLIGDALGCLE